MIKKIKLIVICSMSLNAFMVIKPKNIKEIQKQEIKVNLSGVLQHGVSDKQRISFGLKSESGNGKNYKNLIIGDFSYGETNGIKDTNKMLFHYRFTHVFIKKYDYELFFQDEYNEFKNEKYRILYGSNIRRELKKNNFIGSGLMYSKVSPDKETLNNKIKDKIKLNIYFNLYCNINKKTALNIITFYQPTLYNINSKKNIDFEDYRLLSKINYENKINDRLSFITGFNYSYHSKPYVGVNKKNISLSVELSYQIK